MSKTPAINVEKAQDGIQARLAEYVCGLRYEDVPPAVVHAAKVRIIDTLGALIGGFFGEPCHIARNFAAQVPVTGGCGIIGTRMKTSPDMAAFVNAIAARYVELNDTYHWPGSYEGHPSDVITPVLAAAEHAKVDGREFIQGVIIAYEVFQRFCDVFHNRDFDYTNFCTLGTAAAAGRMLGLSQEQVSHCVSMAAVPNVILSQVRTSHLSMYKVTAAGHAGRAGVFAALLARKGMDGPHLPFEGKYGWCNHVSREHFSFPVMGGPQGDFRIVHSLIKPRPSCGTTISSTLAAEKIGPLRDLADVEAVTVEVYQRAIELVGSGEHRWNPDSRETADHSIPYVVAATLMDGVLTPRAFNDAHLWNPELRALMQKIRVVENPEFTAAYSQTPQEHRTRVTVVTRGGERLVGESGGDKGDLAQEKTDAEIEEKFRGLTEDYFGSKRVSSLLDRLWNLEEIKDVAAIPAAFILA